MKEQMVNNSTVMQTIKKKNNFGYFPAFSSNTRHGISCYFAFSRQSNAVQKKCEGEDGPRIDLKRRRHGGATGRPRSSDRALLRAVPWGDL